MRFTLPLAIAAAALVPTLAVADKANMKPGKYETTMNMTMEGMPFAMPPQKFSNTHCVTQQDIDDGMQKAANPDPKSDCKMKDYKMTGNKATWAMECKSQGSTMNGTGSAEYSGDNYKMKTVMDSEANGMKIRTVMDGTGKRIGDC